MACGVDGQCDCCESAKKEWDRVQRESLKLSLQQQKMQIDMDIIKAEKQRLKVNNKLAHKRHLTEAQAQAQGDSEKFSHSVDSDWKMREQDFIDRIDRIQEQSRMSEQEHLRQIEKLRQDLLDARRKEESKRLELEVVERMLRDERSKNDAQLSALAEMRLSLKDAEEKRDSDREELARCQQLLKEARERIDIDQGDMDSVAFSASDDGTRKAKSSGDSESTSPCTADGSFEADAKDLLSIVRSGVSQSLFAPTGLDEVTKDLDGKYVVETPWSSPDLRGTFSGWIDSNGNPNGHGTLRIEDGSIYIGEWKSGARHGLGVYTSIDGDLYHGFWRDDVYSGRGVFVWPDGRVHTGDYEAGIRQGPGVTSWPFGAAYRGGYNRDQRYGRGVYFYPDGRRYEGEYKDDRPHGRGTEIAADNKILYDGTWSMGEFIKK